MGCVRQCGYKEPTASKIFAAKPHVPPPTPSPSICGTDAHSLLPHCHTPPSYTHPLASPPVNPESHQWQPTTPRQVENRAVRVEGKGAPLFPLRCLGQPRVRLIQKLPGLRGTGCPPFGNVIVQGGLELAFDLRGRGCLLLCDGGGGWWGCFFGGEGGCLIDEVLEEVRLSFRLTGIHPCPKGIEMTRHTCAD